MFFLYFNWILGTPHNMFAADAANINTKDIVSTLNYLKLNLLSNLKRYQLFLYLQVDCWIWTLFHHVAYYMDSVSDVGSHYLSRIIVIS